jgi:hypothetical protein
VSFRHFSLIALLVLPAALAFSSRRAAMADEWQPVSPEDLKMTSYAKAPGASAIILYRQVDRDDSNYHIPHEYNYVREKIFTEEGRKYADIEIPYPKDQQNIVNIRARTVRPDGSIVNFDGKIYDKEIVKSRSLKYLAKTFTLSDVQPGCIIEYHYMVDFKEGYVYDSRWILSEELFTKSAKFTLKPSMDFALQWSWPNGLPEGSKPPVNENNKIIHLEAQDIPAFQIEDDMPPENAMKYRVDFIYSDDTLETDPNRFWKKRDKKLYDKVESFVNKRKAMEEAVAQTVAPGDSPESKLRKLYARVQQLRNTSYEVQKTAQEEKRAKEKGIGSVEDVWKQGYGTGEQITWLFLGLARAAGLEAYPVYVATRDDHFFFRNLMKASDLNTNVVLVKLNGKDLYLDPGTAFTPFGLLPWSESAVPGLKLDKDGGTWVTTSMAEGSESRIERKANFKVTQDGSLEGKLTVTYTGLEALDRRIEERNEDDTARKKFLEDEVRQVVPATIDVDLTNKPEWNSSSPALVAEFDLKVPGWVSGAGRRALLPVGIFSAGEKHVYEHTTRVHPLYFHYLSEKSDDISIDLPLDWRVSDIPKPQTTDAKLLVYTNDVENKNGTLHLQRRLRSDLLSLDQKYYPALRNFYQAVRTSDDQQIVLQPGSAAASN